MLRKPFITVFSLVQSATVLVVTVANRDSKSLIFANLIFIIMPSKYLNRAKVRQCKGRKGEKGKGRRRGTETVD